MARAKPIDSGSSPQVELYLLRHAHAGNPDAWTGDDAERPLSDKGRAQAERLARFLAAIDLKLDAVVTSPKVRARQTAEPIATAVGVHYVTDPRLAGSVDEDVIEQIVADAGGERVMLVGHDPDFSDVAASMTGAEYLSLKKGALAKFDVARPVKPAGALLRWLVPPDLLADLKT
jgi:phosphohistidine phosphatase